MLNSVARGSLRSSSRLAHRLLQSRCYFRATAPLLAPSQVKVMFGSQMGTSQLFAMQLADEIFASSMGASVRVSPLDACPPKEMVEKNSDDDALIFLVSCCGVGEAPDNAKKFVQWVHSDDASSDEVANLIKNRNYAVFGLGNAKTHSENYNVVGKKLDKRMEELGAKRIYPLGLGDDSGCIEDDFDTWSQSLIETLSSLDEDSAAVPAAAEDDSATGAKDREAVCFGELEAQKEQEQEQEPHHPLSNFPEIILENYPEGRVPLRDLFDLSGAEHGSTPFYMPGTLKLNAQYNKHIAPSHESLHEVSLSLEDHPEVTYEVGNHLWIYPQNHPSQIAAYARAINAAPFSIIKGVKDDENKGRPYPFPLNLTVAETLTHCVDLSACPSPTLARFILGRKIDYKTYVAEPRRTTLDLLLEPGSRKLTLSELLYQLPIMAQRYYSISSSPVSHPREILISYRPVKYLSSRGVLREGTCTAYLNSVRPAYDDDEDGRHERVFVPHVAAGIRSNPGFRLPEETSVPLLMIAGGCGIAPIRSFLDERLALAKQREQTADGTENHTPFGEAHLFFGVRTDDDEVYHAIIEHALSKKVLTTAFISHSSSCTNPRFVASDIDDSSELVYNCLERGGHVYLCGGAVGFAPTCADAIKRAIVEHGHMSAGKAEEYYMNLVRGGRYAEDISE